jgi:hypothetical protein
MMPAAMPRISLPTIAPYRCAGAIARIAAA